MGGIPHVGGYPGDFSVQGGAPIGFWNEPLASLHANPWCSSLRRARHFDIAWANLNSYRPTSHRAAIAATQAAGDAAGALGASLWSDE